MNLEILNPLAEVYAEQFCTKEDALLQEVASFTNETHRHAHMMSGNIQGQFLRMISNLLQPVRILEIGTFTGYSALCLAEGLKEDGLLYTIEQREDDALNARRFFNKSSLGDRIILRIGNALSVIPELKENWDLVFIDADKINYINYYELVISRLNRRGLIIADNVLFHGQVLNGESGGKNAKAIHAFNKYIKNDQRIEHLLLTVRDGLMLIMKK